MKCQLVLGQGSKHNLLLDSPLIAGPNAILMNDRSTTPFGAVLTPLLNQAQLQTTQLRFIRTSGGYLLSPGYGRQLWPQARRQYRTRNPRVAKPIIATISPANANEAYKLAQGLGSWEQIEGIALYLTEGQTLDELLEMVEAINSGTDLPLLLRLPFSDPCSYARVCRKESVAALIVAAPPQGEVLEDEKTFLCGELHSPALVALYARFIRQVRNITDLPIIARADASSTQDVLALVAAGAEAVILEGVLWVQPTIAHEIRQELDDKAQRWQVDTWQEFSQHLRRTAVLPLSDQSA
ncbi:MAG: beta/alpha barrel domain-containing protein [Anaerolineae bacterium]